MVHMLKALAVRATAFQLAGVSQAKYNLLVAQPLE